MSSTISAAADRLRAHDFQALPADQQILYLTEAVQRFRDLTWNLEATAEHRVRNLEFDPETQQIGDRVLAVGRGRNYSIRRIGDSYRVVAEEVPPVRDPTILYVTSIEGYDSESGTLRQLDTADRSNRNQLLAGVIRPQRGKAAKSCFLFEYLGDSQDDPTSYWDPGTLFLKHSHEAYVLAETEGESIAISFEYALDHGSKMSCRVTFDLSVGALITGMDQKEIDSRGRLVRDYRLGVSDPSLIETVWVPTQFDLIAWGAIRPDQVTRHEGLVRDIRLGKLSKEDLAVDFPPGTQVRDELTVKNYSIGADRNPISAEVLPASAAAHPNRKPLKEPTSNSPSRLSTLWIVNGLLLVVVACGVMFARRRRQGRVK